MRAIDLYADTFPVKCDKDDTAAAITIIMNKIIITTTVTATTTMATATATATKKKKKKRKK